MPSQQLAGAATKCSFDLFGMACSDMSFRLDLSGLHFRTDFSSHSCNHTFHPTFWAQCVGAMRSSISWNAFGDHATAQESELHKFSSGHTDY